MMRMTKKKIRTMAVVELGQAQEMDRNKILNSKTKNSNNKRVRNNSLKNKLVGSVGDLIKNLMMNHLIYIIGKNVPCYVNVGSVVKS